MTAIPRFAIVALALAASLAAHAQGLQVLRTSSGSNQTNMGSGFVVNKSSTLQREWIVVVDPTMPATFEAAQGVRTTYESTRTGGNFKYLADVYVTPKQPLAAIEIRFLLLDVWGDVIRLLSLSDVGDTQTTPVLYNGAWTLSSENEASRFLTSVGYIARARTKDGKVHEANPQAILGEARKIAKSLSVDDLQPRTDRRP